MLQKHYPIETFDDPLNGYVAAFDPGYQIFRQFGRGRTPAVAEQLDAEVAEQRVVGLLDPDLRGGRQARPQIGQRHPTGRRSDERRVGKERVSLCSLRGSTYH